MTKLYTVTISGRKHVNLCAEAAVRLIYRMSYYRHVEIDIDGDEYVLYVSTRMYDSGGGFGRLEPTPYRSASWTESLAWERILMQIINDTDLHPDTATPQPFGRVKLSQHAIAAAAAA